MKLDDLKGRVAEAFVEDILVQAGYWMARGGRESQLQRLMKKGSDDSPDFLACKSHLTPAPPLHRLIAVEVKYRSDIGQFLRQEGLGVCSKLADQQWPEAYLVLVTDRPDSGKSCFQAIDLQVYVPGTEPITVDLNQVPALGVFETTVNKYENLLKRMFEAVRAEPQKKPVGKLPSRAVALLADLPVRGGMIA